MSDYADMRDEITKDWIRIDLLKYFNIHQYYQIIIDIPKSDPIIKLKCKGRFWMNNRNVIRKCLKKLLSTNFTLTRFKNK